MNKDVGDAHIENPSLDLLFAKDQQRQAETIENPSFEMIPHRGIEHFASQGFFVRGPALAGAGGGVKLLEAEDDPAGTMGGEYVNLTQRQVGGIVGTTEGAGFEAQKVEFGDDLCPGLFLCRIAGSWAGDEYGDFNNAYSVCGENCEDRLGRDCCIQLFTQTRHGRVESHYFLPVAHTITLLLLNPPSTEKP